MTALHPYIETQLARLDLLIHREILRLRAAYQLSHDEFHGLYISDRQIDRLIHSSAPENPPLVETLTAQAAELHRQSLAFLEGSRWQAVAKRFAVTDAAQDALLLALALEAQPKYEILYPYLQDNIQRKLPTVSLTARIFSDDVRTALLPGSPVFTLGLLIPEASEQPVLSTLAFRIASAVAAYLLELDTPPTVPERTWDAVPLPRGSIEPLTRLGADCGPVIFETPDPDSAILASEAICAQNGLSLSTIDLAAIDNAQLSTELEAHWLTQRLHGGATLLIGIDTHCACEAHGATAALVPQLAKAPMPLFAITDAGSAWRSLFPRAARPPLVISLPAPGFAERRQLWQNALAAQGENAAGELLDQLSSRFALSTVQIESAAVTAALQRDLTTPGEPLDAASIAVSVRTLSSNSLGRLARRVTPRFTWNQLVLPPVVKGQLEEIGAAYRHRHLVLGQWGLAQTTGAHNGLRALFSGPSGCGKTMSAEVLAHALGLDLYQIDLSGVVSKYIGETERNLDRLFRAARGLQAILFFDEADALFGKRSEIKDAHDRYANIEVAYLLQKLEDPDFDCLAILCTNLSQNLDPAFSRRLNYTVDFPVPDEASRLRLWQSIFPAEAPLAADADLATLARQHKFTGGEIRNIALNAAYLAAANGRQITMQHLLQAASRQLVKQGKAPATSR